MKASVLEARVRFARPGQSHTAFRLDVEIQVGAGITILFGPSGAGKSTLLDCIAGLLKAGDARITLGEKALQDSATRIFLPPQERHVAYLFQSPALFPHMTVEENTGFGLRHAGEVERKAAVFYLLEVFRVAHLAQRKPGQISGGEAHRVDITRTIEPSPRADLV